MILFGRHTKQQLAALSRRWLKCRRKFAVRLQILTELLLSDGGTGSQSLQVVALSRAERELAELAREQAGLRRHGSTEEG